MHISLTRKSHKNVHIKIPKRLEGTFGERLGNIETLVLEEEKARKFDAL